MFHGLALATTKRNHAFSPKDLKEEFLYRADYHEITGKSVPEECTFLENLLVFCPPNFTSNTSGFAVSSLWLTPYWRIRIEKLSRAIEARPWRVANYVSLVLALGEADQIRAPQNVEVRWLQYYYHLAFFLHISLLRIEGAGEVTQGVKKQLDIAKERLQEVFTKTPVLRLKPLSVGLTVHVAIRLFGDLGNGFMITVKSLLETASCHIQLHVISDAQGWMSFQREIKKLSFILQSRMSASEVSLNDNARFSEAVRLLPCKLEKLYIYALEMLVHEALPDDIGEVILLDVADVVVSHDIADLWRELDNFRSSEIAAVSILNNAGIAGVEYPSGDDRPRLGWHFRTMTGGEYHSGVILNAGGATLWNLRRARAIRFTSIIVRVMRAFPHCGTAAIYSMQMATQVFQRHQDLWRELSSSWQFQATMPYNPLSTSADAPDYHFGLRSVRPLVIEFACPPLPLTLAAMYLSEPRLDGAVGHSHIRKAKRMAKNFTGSQGYSRFFSSDLRCFTKMNLLHASGNAKTLYWFKMLREALLSDLI